MRVLHLLDASAGWEQRTAITQLLERLPAQGIEQRVATIDPFVRNLVQIPDQDVAILPRRLGLPALAGSAIRSFVASQSFDLIHAWGADAAAAARAAFSSGMPIAVTVFDPNLSDRNVRVLRTIGSQHGFAVVCASERVRRRLVERGTPLDETIVLRPGVDFAVVTAARDLNTRQDLGLPDGGQVMLTPPLPSSSDGHTAAVWSVLMRSYLDESVRIIVPGTGRGAERLVQIVRSSEYPNVAIFTEDRIPFEHLCVLADWLVVGSLGDISLTALAWAMAASTPIIAPATYATTELLADDLNARLFKSPDNWRRRGATICAQYDRTDDLLKITEAARGQAYEIFSLRRVAEQHRQLYNNLTQGITPANGISDPALVAN